MLDGSDMINVFDSPGKVAEIHSQTVLAGDFSTTGYEHYKEAKARLEPGTLPSFITKLF